MPLNLSYFYGGEAEQYSFYRIPKALFTDAHYKTVPVEAKVLYGLLLDRMSLSTRNGWLDGKRRVYIYFTLEDAMTQMNCGHNKAVKLFADLEDIGLIERRKQGQGRPTMIYVKNFVLPEEPDQPPPELPQPPAPPFLPDQPSQGEAQTSDFGKSRLPVSGSADFPKANANKTERNKTESNQTDLSIPPPLPPDKPSRPQRNQTQRIGMDEIDGYRGVICQNIDYDLLLQEHPFEREVIDGYVDLMAEACCSRSDYTRINGKTLPTEAVRGRLLKLNREHICYVMESLRQNTTHVRNILAYTLAALYNAPATIGQYYISQVSHDMAQGFG